MNAHQATDLATMLRNHRELLGLSIREVGRRSGIRDTTVMRLEQASIPNPRPETLKSIASVLELDLADVFVASGYAEAQVLPSFTPYLRTKYGDMPETALADLQAYFTRLARKHGMTPDDWAGPQPGEDETDE